MVVILAVVALAVVTTLTVLAVRGRGSDATNAPDLLRAGGQDQGQPDPRQAKRTARGKTSWMGGPSGF